MIACILAVPRARIFRARTLSWIPTQKDPFAGPGVGWNHTGAHLAGGLDGAKLRAVLLYLLLCGLE